MENRAIFAASVIIVFVDRLIVKYTNLTSAVTINLRQLR